MKSAHAKSQRRTKDGKFAGEGKPAVSAPIDVPAYTQKWRAEEERFNDALSDFANRIYEDSAEFATIEADYARFADACGEFDRAFEKNNPGWTATTGRYSLAGASHSVNLVAAQRMILDHYEYGEGADSGTQIRRVTHVHNDPDYDPPADGSMLTELEYSFEAENGNAVSDVIELNGAPRFTSKMNPDGTCETEIVNPGETIMTSPDDQSPSLLSSEGRDAFTRYLDEQYEKAWYSGNVPEGPVLRR